MKYLMLVCVDPALAEGAVLDPIEEWLAAVEGKRLEGDRLRPVSDSTTVRDGGRMITDGPFAETKEQIAGYDILRCASREEAVELAARHPCAKIGAIELRPFWE
jgi:hypothetical protein